MARFEKVEFQVLQVTLVGERSRGRKDWVVLAPNDQRRRLVLAEEFLPLRIQRRVASIAVEQC